MWEHKGTFHIDGGRSVAVTWREIVTDDEQSDSGNFGTEPEAVLHGTGRLIHLEPETAGDVEWLEGKKGILKADMGTFRSDQVLGRQDDELVMYNPQRV